jgi:hypothetical protein
MDLCGCFSLVVGAGTLMWLLLLDDEDPLSIDDRWTGIRGLTGMMGQEGLS